METKTYPIVGIVEGEGDLKGCAVAVVIQDFDKQYTLSLSVGIEECRMIWMEKDLYELGEAQVSTSNEKLRFAHLLSIKPNPLLVPIKARFNMKEAMSIFEDIK